MITTNLGFPRIGRKRALKKACEQYWQEKITLDKLIDAGKKIRRYNWSLQKEKGIDLIPSNDFSFYDHVLDLSLSLGCIPQRYHQLIGHSSFTEQDLYFAMARGIQKDGFDITAMEMTKWFDTNYHYIVPEFVKNQKFRLFSSKIIDEYKEALDLGIKTKPVIPGPVSYLLLGKEKESGFHRIELLGELLPVYFDIMNQLLESDVEYIQFDEPYLAMDLTSEEQDALVAAYREIAIRFPGVKVIVTSYFGCLKDTMDRVLSLPVHGLHLDLVRCPSQLDTVLESDKLRPQTHLSLGLVDGRNIWKNNFNRSLALIQKAVDTIGAEKIIIGPSCSLLHCPCDLTLETNEKNLPAEIKQCMAFAEQKLEEIADLKQLAVDKKSVRSLQKLRENNRAIQNRITSSLIHNNKVKQRVRQLKDETARRKNQFSVRQHKQKESLKLPLFPTTTIGSFPQTGALRRWRADYRKGNITREAYDQLIEKEIEKAIAFQEEVGVDVLVHGEFERNDMVAYFGELLNGFAFTDYGWVQSYGSRCVKPPIIYGDVSRERPMTVRWSSFAQSLTSKPVKGMLTGPVTLLQWSFVRDDQPRWITCTQIALAIKDEVMDLEKAGLKVIQIDEPALREGLPLRKADQKAYLNRAVKAFRISACGVKDQTQIHTHMCYSEFNDIIENIADMDADVITIECSRSQMELLDVFSVFNYPNEIGPGVYDIHSPRVPLRSEMTRLLQKANRLIPARQLWVNPDCGLKTRHWEETKKALVAMVATAQELRQSVNE